MFEVETENLINAIKSKTIAFEKSIKLKQILDTNIPKSIKNYFYLEAEALLGQENYFKIDKDRFDTTSPDVKKALMNLDEILKLNCIFLRNEFILLLEKAITFELNYLSKPRWTLTKFIFKDTNSKSIDEIIALLRYFVDYSYYNDILIGYLNKKNIKRLLISDFDKLLKKIDASLITKYSSYEIATMPKPLLEFINYSNTIKSKNLDINWLLIFYEDKELFGVKSALNLEKEVRGKKYLNFEELSNIIEHLDDLRKPDYKHEVESDYSDRTEKIDSLTNILDKRIILKPQLLEKNDFLKTEKDNKNIELENIEIKNDSNVNQESEITNINHNNDIVVDKESKETSETIDNEKEKKRVIEIIDDFEYEFTILNDNNKNETKEIIDFEIEEDDEKIFIKKLFNKNESLYKSTILDLSKCKSWKEAAAYIDNLFIKYDINPYSNTAINFTDKIQIGFLKNNVY